jgi:hypothetical protein
MKLAIVTSLVLMLSVSLAQTGKPQSQELVEARERYEADLAAVSKPVTSRYLKQLEQMKKIALGSKNLHLAIEVDLEIKRLTPTPTSASVKTADDLARYLSDTTWSWGKAADSGNSRLSFKADGTCAVNTDAAVKWSAISDSSIKLENGTKITFHSNNKAYTAETPAGQRFGVKID